MIRVLLQKTHKALIESVWDYLALHQVDLWLEGTLGDRFYFSLRLELNRPLLQTIPFTTLCTLRNLLQVMQAVERSQPTSYD